MFKQYLVIILLLLSFINLGLASDTPDYVLGPGDEIFIEVFDQYGSEILLLYKETVTGYKPYDIGNPNAGNRYVLSYNGSLELPGLGKFKAKGKKIKDLEKEISLAAKVFDKKPRTVINLLSVKSINVYVVGSVVQPGLHTVKEDGSNNNIVSLIARAGGYRPESDRQQIIIDQNGEKQILALDDRQRSNFTVGDNAYIYVPYKKESVYVIGEVRWPGRQPFHPALSLSNYLAAAGGIISSAADEIYLINDIDQETSQNIKVKIKEDTTIVSVSGPIILKPGTTVFIPKNIFASWREVFSNLLLIKDTINYPKSFNDATTYYIQSK